MSREMHTIPTTKRRQMLPARPATSQCGLVGARGSPPVDPESRVPAAAPSRSSRFYQTSSPIGATVRPSVRLDMRCLGGLVRALTSREDWKLWLRATANAARYENKCWLSQVNFYSPHRHLASVKVHGALECSERKVPQLFPSNKECQLKRRQIKPK